MLKPIGPVLAKIAEKAAPSRKQAERQKERSAKR